MKKSYLFLIVLVVAASGCISQNPDIENVENTTGENTTEEVEMAECANIDISIFQADGQTAVIRQMNENRVGEVRVAWMYQDGDQVSNTVDLEVRGRMVTVQSGSSGSLNSLSVEPLRCPELSFER